jgi:hypothetical protein
VFACLVVQASLELNVCIQSGARPRNALPFRTQSVPANIDGGAIDPWKPRKITFRYPPTRHQHPVVPCPAPQVRHALIKRPTASQTCSFQTEWEKENLQKPRRPHLAGQRTIPNPRRPYQTAFSEGQMYARNSASASPHLRFEIRCRWGTLEDGTGIDRTQNPGANGTIYSTGTIPQWLRLRFSIPFRSRIFLCRTATLPGRWLQKQVAKVVVSSS